MIVVDAHEDIAMNILLYGRDYSRSVADTRQREAGTAIPQRGGVAMLGWPEWLTGRVAVVFATLYVSPARYREGPWDTQCYANKAQAHRLYWQQVHTYQQLAAAHPDKFYLIRSRADLEQGLAPWQNGNSTGRRVGLVLLMEGADGILQPSELPDWHAAGLRIIGPAWDATRYAGGTQHPGPLTNAGRELLRQMARLGMTLDLSHMTDAGVDEALDTYSGPIIASHSNARALLPNAPQPQRHLRAETIRRIAGRGGVIGVVLLQSFLGDGGIPFKDLRRQLPLETVIAQIDYSCQLVGHTRHIGLGSDMDGSFGQERTPFGLDSVADLTVIGEELSKRGYSAADIEGIMGGNWLNLLRRTLPD